MKKALLSLSLLVPFLTSLSSCSLDWKPYVYSRPALAYAEATYEDVCIERNADELIDMSRDGKPFLFIVTSETCSSCARFEKDFSETIIETGAECYMIMRHEDGGDTFSDDIETLQRYYAVNSQQMGPTPVVYLSSGENLTTLAYGAIDKAELRRAIDGNVSISGNGKLLATDADVLLKRYDFNPDYGEAALYMGDVQGDDFMFLREKLRGSPGQMPLYLVPSGNEAVLSLYGLEDSGVEKLLYTGDGRLYTDKENGENFIEGLLNRYLMDGEFPDLAGGRED